MNLNSSSRKKISKSTKCQKSLEKIKLTDLSRFIFRAIRQNSPLEDSYLMQLLVSKFGSFKTETLKRRKYDVINTLEKADILVVDQSDLNSMKYYPKTEILNARKDVQKIKEEVQKRAEEIKKKQGILKMLKNTRNNLKKLIQINKKRQTDENNRINFPILVMTEDFTQCSRVQNEKGKEQIKLKFPPQTKYINNFMGVENLIKTQL